MYVTDAELLNSYYSNQTSSFLHYGLAYTVCLLQFQVRLWIEKQIKTCHMY